MQTAAIADELGLRPGTVNKYRRDPTGARERSRRENYRGQCQGCGQSTDGSAGPDGAPDWCAACAPNRRRRWSDERLLEAIREWNHLTGAPPRTYDWSPARAPDGHPGAKRYLAEPGRWPNERTVTRRLGTLARAVAMAGLTSRSPG